MPATVDDEGAAHKTAKPSRRDAVINVRVPVKTRDLIDTAAASLGKTRTEFVIESAKQHAAEVLLDRRLFSLDDSAYQAFLDVLENPPEPSLKLKRLFEDKAPWEV